MAAHILFQSWAIILSGFNDTIEYKKGTDLIGPAVGFCKKWHTLKWRKKTHKNSKKNFKK